MALGCIPEGGHHIYRWVGSMGTGQGQPEGSVVSQARSWGTGHVQANGLERGSLEPSTGLVGWDGLELCCVVYVRVSQKTVKTDGVHTAKTIYWLAHKKLREFIATIFTYFYVCRSHIVCATHMYTWMCALNASMYWSCQHHTNYCVSGMQTVVWTQQSLCEPFKMMQSHYSVCLSHNSFCSAGLFGGKTERDWYPSQDPVLQRGGIWRGVLQAKWGHPWGGQGAVYWPTAWL